MRRIHKKAGVGKVIAGVLMGSVVGATVGWLTAPSSVEEIRRRWMGDRLSDRLSAPEKAKNATGNLESKFRDLAEESSDPFTRPATVHG
jgi:gas vesicle protein